MPHKRLTKYILDIESVIVELELIQARASNQFVRFEEDVIARRAAERLLEIIGEAINQMLKIDSTIHISHSREIIGLRNKIVHAYDSINAALLWGIMLNDLPVLKSEIQKLKE
jgi:uncharacterized protein with HEPN domain